MKVWYGETAFLNCFGITRKEYWEIRKSPLIKSKDKEIICIQCGRTLRSGHSSNTWPGGTVDGEIIKLECLEL